MKSVLTIFCCLMSISFAASASQADLILRIAQTSPLLPGDQPADLQVENAAAGVFGIFVRSTTAGQTLRGVDFTLSLSNQNGLGGQLVSGTNNLLVTNSVNPGGFFPNSFPATTVVYGNNANTSAATPIVGTSESLFATVTLSTVGASLGSYSISLSGITLLDVDNQDIALSSNSVLSTPYTISAVPEPTSMALVGVAGLGALWGYRRRSKAS